MMAQVVSSRDVLRPCSALVYDHGAEPRADVSPQQQLVDRLARKNWHACHRETSGECKRCGLALCAHHGHAEDRRCRACEQDFYLRRQRSGLLAALAYAGLVFAAGAAAAFLGYKWGLIAAIGALALAPAAARIGGMGWARKRFLRERKPRELLPHAQARS